MMWHHSVRLLPWPCTSEMGIDVNRLRACLLLTLLLLLPASLAVRAATPPAGNAAANTSWYDVELIVFRYTDPQAGDMESWPADPGIPDWKNAAPLVTPANPATDNSTALTPFMQIDAHQLDNAWNRLKHSSDYQPLLHVAWIEPLADHTTAASVQIGVPPPAPAVNSVAGLVVTPLPQPAPTSGMKPSGTSTATLPGQTQPAPATPTPVYGTVKFSQYGPYLHFDLDLVCQGPIAKHIIQVPAATTNTSPVPADASITASAAARLPAATQGFQWYRMTEDRRIEAGKLNYFDNPMFGVLVLVTPHQTTPVTR
jgi:Peptidoglycan-binding protein, CsiV